ncbi:unnamed protein product [Orchesella dallaii]|uniref:HSA domain-containing protein n=1 Tax=Orchesella dallaii TaxID=48710 RepID=A0ABP1S905_9HEXA
MKYSAEFDTNYKIRQRVRELKYEGLWTATRLPKVYERPRSKNHWDYVLEEMTWMAEDFASEKRWKMNAAKQVAKMVEQYHIQNKLKQGEDKISPKQPVMYLSIDLDSRSCPTEDFLTYPKEYDSEDQTWMAKLLDWEDQMEMPFMIYGPPTPPPDGEFELCEDLAVGYLYKYGIMEESELPRVYVPKRKMKKSIASLKTVNDLNSRGRLPTTFNPQSLFGHCPPKLLDDQNKKRLERTHRPLRPWEPRSLPISFVRPISASPQSQFNPSSENWIAQEDAFLWETVRNTFTLLETPRLHPIFPGHCMNWKYMEDAGKLVGMTFKSQQKSFSRYQTLLSLQANKNTSKFPNLHTSHSPINFQQDNGSVEFETLRRAKFQTILALRSKRRLSFPNLADQDSKVNLEQNKVKMEVLLGLKFNINYDKPLGVKDFPKKELKIVEQVQRQKVEVSTLAPSTAMVVQSKELAYKSSTSVAKVAVPPGPAPASPVIQPIKMEVSSSPKPPPSPVNKVEIVKCGPLTVEVKTPVTVISTPTTALPLPSQSIIVTPSSHAALRESTAVKGKEIESHSQPPKPVIVPQESIVDNVVTPKATNDATGPGIVISQPSALSFNRPSGTLVRPIQKVRPTQNIIRPPPPTVPATSSGLGQFVQAQAFTTPISTSTSPRYYIFRVPPGTTINSVNRELLQQSISNLSVSRLMEFGLPVSIETATATSQVNLPQKTILNVQPRPLPTRAEDVKLPHLVLETGATSSSVVSDVVNSTLSGPKILVVPTQTPRNASTTTISSVRANPPASVSTQPKPVSGCLATQIRQFGISQFLPKRTKTIRIVSEAPGVPQPVVLNSATTPLVTRPLQVAPATSHQRQTVSSLFVCSTPSQIRVQQSPQTTRSGPQSVGSITQASPSLRPPAATHHVQVRRMPIISLQRLQAQAIQETPRPPAPGPIIVRNARNEKQLFTRPAIISQGRRTTGCQPSLVLVRTSPPPTQQSNVPVADPRVGAPSGVQEE